MLRAVPLLTISLLIAAPAAAGPADDATAVATQILDKFNGGDVNAFVAAHQSGALIVDEFAPHIWNGPNSAQRWVSDYTKDAEKRGISGGRVDYDKPLQANSDGKSAYIVLPTTYRFTQNGKKMIGKGSMTFVMARSGAIWKIASWTYSGGTPAPE
ncbi:SnoaL-like domain-containing protein [Sphingomonas sp. HDW15A]|uniref:nuclear transport factor 2 family protein n=1 Tax=Sphingomonas sp. HDW15A TaxID=2714942 RepID=UPI001409818E|nr:nuclear transport factor 2 family protein [Sphingomonas sp. HDW15A]QIK95271.1 SnoaL-like domain-containing protein [Sphingomonas sp. HDW15A]